MSDVLIAEPGSEPRSLDPRLHISPPVCNNSYRILAKGQRKGLLALAPLSYTVPQGMAAAAGREGNRGVSEWPERGLTA